MCIEWKDNKSVIGKSGDLLLARLSQKLRRAGETPYAGRRIVSGYNSGLQLR